MEKFVQGKIVCRRWLAKRFTVGNLYMRAYTSGWGCPYTRGSAVERNPKVFTDARNTTEEVPFGPSVLRISVATAMAQAAAAAQI